MNYRFGREIGYLHLAKTGKASDPFAESFDFVQKQLDLRFILTAFSVRLGRLLAKRPKMTAARQTLEGYVYELIDARSEADTPAETYRDLLGLFMEFSDEKGASLSRSELKDSALNLIIAGRSALVETTFIKI